MPRLYGLVYGEERISRRAILDLTFREADWKSELYLEFQPIYETQTNQIRAG